MKSVMLQSWAALSFAHTLQLALQHMQWNVAPDLPGMYACPGLLSGPGIRIVIDRWPLRKVVLNPALGRVFMPGPHQTRSHALFHVAAPGQTLLTEAALSELNTELNESGMAPHVMDGSYTCVTAPFATPRSALPADPHALVHVSGLCGRMCIPTSRLCMVLQER